jgi:Xaa-Pro dipeptidase
MHMIGGSRCTLRAGIAVGIEPPVVLHEERLGASIIDIVLVSRDGCKSRWRSSRDLIVV